ncbi:MAG: oligoendopeptidase F, partial [Cellulosilyticaceae bacterium]
MSQNTIITRQDVATEDTWRLEDIFATDQEATLAMATTKEQITKLLQFKGRLLASAETLYEALQAQDQLSLIVGKIYVYSHMRLHQDGGNSFYQDLASRAENLMIEAGSATSYMLPELKELTTHACDALIAAYAPLELYRRQLYEVIRQQAHILDDASESLLSQFQEIAGAPSNIYAMFNNADIKFPAVKDAKGNDYQLTQGRFVQLLESQDRVLRKNAFDGLYTTYAQYRNTIATTFAANVKQYDLFAKLRHFKSPLVGALDSNN